MANSSSWQVGVIRVAQFAAAMAIVSLPAGGSAQSDYQADFTPAITQKVDARSEPAKVTTEDESGLTSKGYVKIGTIKAAQPGKKASAGVTEGLRAAALSKAAGAGGDVVHFEREGAVDTTEVPTGKVKRTCIDSQSHQVYSGQTSHSVCSTDVHGMTNCHQVNDGPKYNNVANCVKWGDPKPVIKYVKGVVSEGTVWRYDPKLQKASATMDDKLSHEQYAEAELLLAHGADVNARDKDGWTHLHVAAMGNDSRKPVEWLLAHGADVNAKNNIGSTPLHAAASWGNKEVAELLLAHGADVNARDHNGFTPLLDAASSGISGQHEKELVAKLLLAHGADVNATDNNGRTPLRWAEERKNKDIVDLLQQHGGHE